MADFALANLMSRPHSVTPRRSIQAHTQAPLTRTRSVSLNNNLVSSGANLNIPYGCSASRSTTVRSGPSSNDHLSPINSNRGRTSQPNLQSNFSPTNRASYIDAPTPHEQDDTGSSVFRSLVNCGADSSSEEDVVETVQLSASTETFDSAVLASEKSTEFTAMRKLNKNLATTVLSHSANRRLRSGDSLNAVIDMQVHNGFEYIRIYAIITCTMITKKDSHEIVMGRHPIRENPGKFGVGRYSIPVVVDVPEGPPTMAWNSPDLRYKIEYKLKIVVEKFLGTAVSVSDTANILLCETVLDHETDVFRSTILVAETTVVGKKELSMTAQCDSMLPFGDDKEPLRVNVNLNNPAGRRIESVQVKCRQELRCFVQPDDSAIKAEVVPARALLQSVAPLRRLSTRARETDSSNTKSAMDEVANKILYPHEMRKKYNRPEGLRYYSDFQKTQKIVDSKEQNIDLVMVLHPSDADFRFDVKGFPYNLAHRLYKSVEGEGEHASTKTKYELGATFDFACEKFEVSTKYFVNIKAIVNDGIGQKAVLRAQLPVTYVSEYMD
ncbi:hypothetical protein SARC_07351 [Sphaeroforma arctica JP610]|uniref:Uncharacterized protein n=1 Tax=Sphaeroforma arctica JP610 TaxID=667725 RepID=A0A0L0FUQ1_9EUKA|nr:hypothetical protein SARC_07351 [Sphaeroforma arctica JP610]KNC80286.1 hypothetical protein SARC_07351 [Sphaeroforma arctica JP610]|eukprot:XP_014154188.1 hypothetical protein SARC_07351 [Sphaeroforma arctica JP610]